MSSLLFPSLGFTPNLYNTEQFWKPTDIVQTTLQFDFTNTNGWVIGTSEGAQDPSRIPNLANNIFVTRASAHLNSRIAASHNGSELLLNGSANNTSLNSGYALNFTAGLAGCVAVIRLNTAGTGQHMLFGRTTGSTREVMLLGESASQNYAISLDGTSGTTGSFRVNGESTINGPGGNVAYANGVNGRLPENEYMILYIEFTPRSFNLLFAEDDFPTNPQFGLNGTIKYLIGFNVEPSSEDVDRAIGFAAWETGEQDKLDSNFIYKNQRP